LQMYVHVIVNTAKKTCLMLVFEVTHTDTFEGRKLPITYANSAIVHRNRQISFSWPLVCGGNLYFPADRMVRGRMLNWEC
jgi:hypothetical protein